MVPAVLVQLSRGMHTLIDAQDLPMVAKTIWTPTPAVNTPRLLHYAQGHVARGSIGLHRYLLGDPGELIADHINGDGLDNRRSVNLRAVSRSVNCRNRHYEDAPLSLGILPPGLPIVSITRIARGETSVQLVGVS